MRARVLSLLVVLAGLLTALAGASSAARADTGDPLVYYGGPVVHSVSGVVVDWGSNVSGIYTNETTGDPGMIKHLAASTGNPGTLDGVLSQYLDTSGLNAARQISYGGQFQINPSVTSTTIEDSQIQSELISQIQAGHLPAPSGDGVATGTIYLVLFPAGDQICMPDGNGGSACSGSTFCAYHGSAQLSPSQHILYAVLPDNTSGAMAQGCGGAATALQNQTSYTSHEWSEAITDPLVAEANSDSPPLAWYDDNCSTVGVSPCNYGEIGDKCEPQQGQEDGWTLQLEWSNLDSDCELSEPSYQAPVANFNPPSATAGQSISFDGTPSSDPPQDTASASYGGQSYTIDPGLTSYVWNWGDGSAQSTGATASHTFASGGTFQVSLTVTDNMGFHSTVTRAVSVAGPGGATSTTTNTGSPATGSSTTSTTGSSTSPTTTSTSGATTSPPTSGRIPRPSVRTASGKATTSSRARLTGSILSSAPARVHFEYGTTRRYGRSSATVTVPAGSSWRSVTALLAGLRPRTRYHYRIVATDQAGTTVGADRTFTTPRAVKAPRLTVQVRRGAWARAQVREHRALVVGFGCTLACTAHFQLVVLTSGIQRLAPVPMTLARGTGRLSRAGRGRVRIAPLADVSAAALSQPGTHLVLLGYATGRSGVHSRTISITLS